MHTTPVARPLHVPYQWKSIRGLPSRLVNPPPAPCKVRSLKISPDFRIDLVDILDNKHLPPMALKDFEEYLLFTEYTAENLYFIMWLRDYTHMYSEHEKNEDLGPNDEAHVSSGDVALLFNRALSTFFDPDSNLALNLPHSLSAPVRALPAHTSHPAPADLDDVRTHVHDLLNKSLGRFVKKAYGNAERNRSWFSVICGIIHVVLGIIVVLGSVTQGWARIIRLFAYPNFLFGFLFFIAGMHGMCMIIFAFAGADARQLRAYELAAPQIPKSVGAEKPVAVSVIAPFSTAALSTLDSDRFSAADHEERTVGMSEAGHRDVKDEKANSGDDSSSATTRSFTEYLCTAAFIPGSPISTDSTAFTTNASQPTYKFDFDALPNPVHQRKESITTTARSKTASSIFSTSSPMFGSLTRVMDPIATRSQWEIATRSCVASFIISTALMTGLMFVPFATKHH